MPYRLAIALYLVVFVDLFSQQWLVYTIAKENASTFLNFFDFSMSPFLQTRIYLCNRSFLQTFSTKNSVEFLLLSSKAALQGFEP